MFISNLQCPERGGNRSSLTFKCIDSKTLKSMNFVTSWSTKPMPRAFLFPLFLADLDKKYRNEIQMDNK